MSQQYPYYPGDVAEEYETEPPRLPNSNRRYRQGDFKGTVTTPVALRSSLRPSRSGTSTISRPVRTGDINSAQTERLSPTWQPPMQPSRAVKPLPPQNHRRFQNDYPLREGNWIQRHLGVVGGGMCTALLLVLVGRHLIAWYSNTLGDPLTYTQAAHQNTQTVTIAGHRAQVFAFVGEHERLEAVVIPESGKPQLLEGGVVPFVNPLISVAQEPNGDVLVTVQGAFTNDLLWPSRPITQIWKLPQGK